MNEKFIEKFQINIGQSSMAGLPTGEPIITFIINDRFCSCRLEEFKDWIEDICASKGNKSDKAYEAKRNLDQFFNELLHPWFKVQGADNQ